MIITITSWLYREDIECEGSVKIAQLLNQNANTNICLTLDELDALLDNYQDGCSDFHMIYELSNTYSHNEILRIEYYVTVHDFQKPIDISNSPRKIRLRK